MKLGEDEVLAAFGWGLGLGFGGVGGDNLSPSPETFLTFLRLLRSEVVRLDIF